MSIPIPAGMEQAPVTWTLGHTTGTEALRGARGMVRFEPTAVAVAYPDVTVLPATVTARVNAGVMDSVDLTVNDPELWNWRVTPELGPAWPAFHIDVPVEGVDLATAVVVPGIGPIRAVTGPPGTTEWDDLTGKPATYPPATHTHEVTDVDGLTARLAALEYDSGWRVLTSWDGSGTRVGNWTFPSGVAPTPGSAGSVRIRRVGRRVEWLFYGCSWTGNAVLFQSEIPTGFRTGDTGWIAPVSVGLTLADLGTLRRRTWGFYINDASGKTSHTTYGTHFGYETNEPIPTTLPGTPA